MSATRKCPASGLLSQTLYPGGVCAELEEVSELEEISDVGLDELEELLDEPEVTVLEDVRLLWVDNDELSLDQLAETEELDDEEDVNALLGSMMDKCR